MTASAMGLQMNKHLNRPWENVLTSHDCWNSKQICIYEQDNSQQLGQQPTFGAQNDSALQLIHATKDYLQNDPSVWFITKLLGILICQYLLTFTVLTLKHKYAIKHKYRTYLLKSKVG